MSKKKDKRFVKRTHTTPPNRKRTGEKRDTVSRGSVTGGTERQVFPVATNLSRGPLEAKNICVGMLRQNGTDGFVEPDSGYDPAQYGRITIRFADLHGAPFDMKVVCEIKNPDAEPGTYEAKIIEVLGDPGNTDVAMTGILRQYGLPPEFAPEVTAEAANLPIDPPEDSISHEIASGRKDLRGLKTVTIDGEDAKDLDDAISVEKIPGRGFRLYVHIADVSHYVHEGSVLDAEARKRGTSVYLADRVIPMLPPRLSNGLCSLNPQVPRLALTAEMLIGFDGAVIDGDIYESVIKSDLRASYKKVYDAVYANEDVEGYEDLRTMFAQMRELKDILKETRQRRGAIEFDFPETKVALDEAGKPINIYAYPINEANGIIEEFMILCNEFVASRFSAMKYPFVYRVHEEPDPVKIREFLHLAKQFGVRTGHGKADSAMLANLLEQIAGLDFEPALSQLLLRSLAKARYAPENLGHFGLASTGYCHFTSPIRRYPDLYIHRIIKDQLRGARHRALFAAEVGEVSTHSSDAERNAMEAERASVNQKACEYMAQKIGETFDGLISGIIRSGIFVRLECTVEGMVPFRSMDDYFTFDEQRLEARGRSSGIVYRIGQPVRVTVAAVDTILRRIDFTVEVKSKKNLTSDQQKSKKTANASISAASDKAPWMGAKNGRGGFAKKKKGTKNKKGKTKHT